MTTLLVAPPGAITEALRATLQSIHQVDISDRVSGCLSAAQAIRSLAPDLVIISGQIPTEEILALIELSACERQAPRVLVLSASQALEQRFLAAGAFAVVAPWDSVDRLQAVIRDAALRTKAHGSERQPARSHQSPRAAASSGDAATEDFSAGAVRASELDA